MKKLIIGLTLFLALIPLSAEKGMFISIEAPQIQPEEAEMIRDAMSIEIVSSGRGDLLPVGGVDFLGLTPQKLDLVKDSYTDGDYFIGVHLKLLELKTEETLVEVPPKRKKIYEEGGAIRPPSDPVFRVESVLLKGSWEATFLYAGNEITFGFTSFGNGPTRNEAWDDISNDVTDFIRETLISFDLTVGDRIVQILKDRSRIAVFSNSHTRGTEFFLRGYTEDGKSKNYGIVQLLGDVEAGSSQEVASFYHSPNIGFELVQKSNWSIFSHTFTTIPFEAGTHYTLTESIIAKRSRFLFNSTFHFGAEGVFIFSGADESISPWSSIRAIIGADIFSVNMGEFRLVSSIATGVGYRWNSDWKWYSGARITLQGELMVASRFLTSLRVGYEFWGPLTLKEYETPFYSGFMIGLGFGVLL